MAFWKPGTVAPGSSIDRDSDSTALEGGAGAGAGAVTGRIQQVAVSERRNRLPIAKQRARPVPALLSVVALADPDPHLGR